MHGLQRRAASLHHSEGAMNDRTRRTGSCLLLARRMHAGRLREPVARVTVMVGVMFALLAQPAVLPAQTSQTAPKRATPAQPAKPAAPQAAPAPGSQSQDVKAIQAREALRSDERLLAYHERFRAALVEKAGPDPLLSALVVSENEAQALVHASPAAAAEHVIWQEGKWVSTDGRQLKPWSPDAPASVAQFRLSAVPDRLVRERIKAYRGQPGRATDFVSTVRVGFFGPPFDRTIVELQVASMTSGLGSAQYDLASGESLDVVGAIKEARAARETQARKDAEELREARKRNLVKEAPEVLGAFRRDVGDARLMAVYIKRHEVTFVQADRAMVDYDPRGRFARRDKPYDREWLCTQGFDDREVDWASFPALVQKALLARGLDEEDREHAEIDVERPRDCKPINLEIRFTNYKLPQPSVSFDASGRVKR
jgi:hypothetical protein